MDNKVEIKSAEVSEDERLVRALAKSAWYMGPTSSDNPWSAEDVDKLEIFDLKKEYNKSVNACRFFYRRDPIASKVIDKMIDIAITGVRFSQGDLSENQLRVFLSIKAELEEFLEECALEYLIAGMVIPEVRFSGVTKLELQEKGIKTYPNLELPKSFWIRDNSTIMIKDSLLGNRPSYFVEIPQETKTFIQNQGVYATGIEDKELYYELVKLYPEFVRQVEEGKQYVLLEGPLVVRAKYLPDSPYPIPYLYPALESLKHKRNLRRMDYSISSRVISAIQLFKLGNDEFPLTEGDEDQLEDLKQEVKWRNSGNRDIERIFQLFANHTLDVSWVFPPVDALLDDKKYADVNADIFYALGFPKILLVGEAQRSGSSDAESAVMSPIKTMEVLRRKLLPIAEKIVRDIVDKNPQLKSAPKITFEPMDLVKFSDFLEGIQKLYETRNLSRTSYAEKFGYILEDEWRKIAEEDDLMKTLGIQEFAPQPFSPQPNRGNDIQNDKTDPEDNQNDSKNDVKEVK